MASLLKRDIMLSQPAMQLTDTGPEVLPPLIQAFLADSIGIDLESIPDAWDILKDHGWKMTSLAEHVETEKRLFVSLGGLEDSVSLNPVSKLYFIQCRSHAQLVSRCIYQPAVAHPMDATTPGSSRNLSLVTLWCTHWTVRSL
jgi:hypothetical protein